MKIVILLTNKCSIYWKQKLFHNQQFQNGRRPSRAHTRTVRSVNSDTSAVPTIIVIVTVRLRHTGIVPTSLTMADSDHLVCDTVHHIMLCLTDRLTKLLKKRFFNYQDHVLYNWRWDKFITIDISVPISCKCCLLKQRMYKIDELNSRIVTCHLAPDN